MERINLNVPSPMRKRLRGLARRIGRPEAVLARELLSDALDRLEAEEFYRQVTEAYTPRMRKRDLEILAAFEKIDG